MIWLTLLACKEDPPKGDDSAVDCSAFSLEMPSPRKEVSGAWDADGRRFVFFGGDVGIPEECISQTSFVDETWIWSEDCNAFSKLDAAGPSARGRHATALDSARKRMIIHGGRYRDGTSGNYTLLDDTWAFDFATDTWTQLASGGPPGRANHVIAVSGDQLLLYGGNTSINGASFTPMGDLWSLDLNTNTWTELSGSNNGPGKRLFHAADISADGATLYVYGGGDENAFTGPFFGDLWALDVASGEWTELHGGGGKKSPDARIWPNLLADGGKLWLLGGHDDTALGNTNQIYSFDLAAGEWTLVSEGDLLANDANGFCDFPADFVEPDLSAPERRNANAAALTGPGQWVWFGGSTDCGIINDLWTYSDGAWTERSTATFGEICLRAYAECSTMCF